MQNSIHQPLKKIHSALSIAFAALAISMAATPSHAGGGPENVFLVVNPTSQASKSIANHYINLRNIPASNVFHIEYDEHKGHIESVEFKEKFLKPILEAIGNRGLAGQIDYVVYSSGFPWMVNFRAEMPSDEYGGPLQPHGSLTGSTYLWNFALNKRPELFRFATNFYCLPRPSDTPPKSDPSVTRGFRSTYRWQPDGTRTPKLGLPYMLSAMLGVTTGRGTTTEEVVRYLKVARQADGTHPKGTFYFMKHDGPRSITRHNLFPQAVNELKKSGHNAVLLDGIFPRNKQDIAGITFGTSFVNLATANCKFLPGALCDNLTSSGGKFQADAKQNAITEFLNYGAAGASGTVVEPTAMPQKFPTPFLHLHYVRGCSMAEAFYQSIHAPFQPLVVGDPLCQPWAFFPVVSVTGLPEGKFITDTITLVPSSTTKPGSSAAVYELFIDGVRKMRCKPDGNFQLDTATLADGYHELRVVAVDSTPIETQGRWIAEIEVNNQGESVQLSLENRRELPNANRLTLKVASNRNHDVVLLHNGKELGIIPKDKQVVRISTKSLGTGPITLQARSQSENPVLSTPLQFEIPTFSLSNRFR